MGSALGYALTQPSYVSLAIFTSLGLGMSLPYLLLGAFPRLIGWLPKPGAWMETFKQFLGFVMLATVIWLLWVFGSQTGNTSLFLMLFALLFSSISVWIYGHFGSPLSSLRKRRLSYVASGIFLLGAFALAYVASEQTSEHAVAAADEVWEQFSAERLAELRASNTPVLIDFTAKWCLICQTNHLVLSQRSVDQKFNERGVVRMKADWTRHDPAITAELRKHGRSGVPLYVLYKGDAKSEATILPQVLTADIVMKSIDSISYAL